MINKHFLEKLLQSGLGNNSRSATSGGVSDMLKGKGGAALAGGALGLLLGSKKGRKLGGKVLTYGGLAAVGVLAYKAYTNWQQSEQMQTAPAAQPLENLSAAEADEHSKAILIALIAAAKADGHIDDRERHIIDNEVAKLTADQALLSFIDQQLQQPLDPANVAKYATSRDIAVEMFLASVLVIDEESFMERSYLNELAKQLALPESLQNELQYQARQAQQLTAAQA
ncbi:tellurite resistance TerB family protein [Rheinheimera sp. UJ51]|uniref:tellurite resistance TerB family protein n=1 Tax=unclassified Rheinheimera TaxID=115860 RepID=UPI001E5A2E0E|nr:MULTISPECIES: tellurite resistance TerB family protein [unclassified Rheinheimera]MCC5451765.1 tellurite resistance TerB family protein [Rheinheimera sp. UJ51]MCF4009628.1 tellurite resistance TerB family protein [Rheinheimera sp. UJ63]